MGWAERRVLVRVPATSANLGPGFDALGLALTLYDEVSARVIPSGLTIDVCGEGAADVADAAEAHLVVRAMRAAFDDLGAKQPPGLALRCVNRIPHGRGLGSSAAAIVAGILAARALADAGVSAGEALPLANELEGHPDNVATCLFGGLTIAWLTDSAPPGGRPPAPPDTSSAPPGGRPPAPPDTSSAPPGGRPPAPPDTSSRTPRAMRLQPAEEITPVAIIAPAPVSTKLARGLMPARVPHSDAARNAGRAALLIAALTTRPEVLLDATEDRLHQDYRAPAMPATHELVSRLRAAGLPAVVSGAGPSVLALLTSGQGRDRLDSIVKETGIQWRVSPLDVERQGASVAPGVPSTW
jgi:homoserine kinase